MAVLSPAFSNPRGTAPLPRRPGRAGRVLLWLALWALGFGTWHVSGQGSREYQLKAAFLFNFTQFTEWPSNAFATPDEPLVIGIVGADPFGPALDEIVRGETVHGRTLTVVRYRRAEDVKSCHVLFISQSETRQLDQMVKELKAKPVLTVSDIESATYRGAMIGLFTENNKIRFRINLPAVTAAHLTLSSKLLRAAEVIDPATRP